MLTENLAPRYVQRNYAGKALECTRCQHSYASKEHEV